MNNFSDVLFQDEHLMRDTMPIVIRSRIRLARNLSDVKFVKYACRNDLRDVSDRCENVLKKLPLFKDCSTFNINDLSEYERTALVEHHLCSQEFLQDVNEPRLVMTRDHLVSIMINEEDHLRVQVFGSDLNFREMFDRANEIDDVLNDGLNIAFDDQYGYLTSCPTNVGTGMRASVMVHLPALVLTKQIYNLIHSVQKLGFVVRGIYGEGSEAHGNFFQISNQQTLGLSEADILSRLCQIIRSVMDYETNAREMLKKERWVALCDNIGRSIGILRGCYCINTVDAMNYISFVLLAVDMGYLPEEWRSSLHLIVMRMQNAHIQVLLQKQLKQIDIDTRRAEILRKFFSGMPDVKF